MAGHSHWARIKRAKAVVDARRGRAWSKLSRAVIVAARSGGGDPSSNLALRYAIDACRDANMPKDTIDRAIKKGTGEGSDVDFVELVFEGYGPGGAAVMAVALTDNRNRTAPEIKKIFEMKGGKLGAANSVARMFTKRGVFIINAANATEEQLTELALEAGADDVQSIGEAFELSCDPTAFGQVRQALDAAEIKPESAEITMIADNNVELVGDAAEQMLKLIDGLEEHDDVQNVYTNFEMSQADADRLSQ